MGDDTQHRIIVRSYEGCIRLLDERTECLQYACGHERRSGLLSILKERRKEELAFFTRVQAS